jgi:hypothetical protein
MGEIEDFARAATEAAKPLVDDLARQVGESPEAWRGIKLTISGLGSIISRSMESTREPGSTIAVVFAILCAIEEHEAMRAAEPHWRRDE